MNINNIVKEIHEAIAQARERHSEHQVALIIGEMLSVSGTETIRALTNTDGELAKTAADALGNVSTIAATAVHMAKASILKDREANRILAGGIPQHPSVFETGPAIRSRHIHPHKTGVILHGLRACSLTGEPLRRNDDLEGYPIPIADKEPTLNDRYNYIGQLPTRSPAVMGYLIGDGFADIPTHEANTRPTPFIIGSLIDEATARKHLAKYEILVKHARLRAWIRRHRSLSGPDGWTKEKKHLGEQLLTNYIPLEWENGRTTYIEDDFGKSYFTAGDHCIERTRLMSGIDRLARIHVSPAQFRLALRLSEDDGWQEGAPYNGNATNRGRPEIDRETNEKQPYNIMDISRPPSRTLLANPEAFPEDMSGDATRSETVRMVLRKSNSSWRTPPRPEDLESALRGEGTRERRRFVLTTYIAETTFDELMAAKNEGAFTWRRLATALHRDEITNREVFADINRYGRQ